MGGGDGKGGGGLEGPAGRAAFRDSDDLERAATQITPLQARLGCAREVVTIDLQAQGGSHLVEIVGGSPGRTHRLGDSTRLGRDSACEVNLMFREVSRKHASIGREGEDYVLSDLGSANGTYVNGVRIQRHLLRLGDRVGVGRALMLYTRHDDLEDRIIHQQKMESLGRLAGGIAHDFNNLLGAMLANLSVLLSMDQSVTIGDGEVRETLHDIELAGRMATEFTQQLLSFARSGSYEERAVDLSKLTENALGIVGRTFAPDIHVHAKIEPTVTVAGDASQLHQVLIGLLIHARDAVKGGGTLRVTLRRGQAETIMAGGLVQGTCALLTVTDSGPGLDDEAKRRVFEPFFSSKVLGQGTGLGLATVYGVVRQHGGDISVESQLGQGTTLRILLPTALADSPGVQESFAEKTTPPFQTVLVVDDEPLLARSTQRVLQLAGYTAVLAAGGREAVELLRKMMGGVDLVLLDFMLPSMSGEQLCRTLHEVDPKVPILAIGAVGRGSCKDRALEAGASGFLERPFTRGDLERAIARAMQHAPRGAFD